MEGNIPIFQPVNGIGSQHMKDRESLDAYQKVAHYLSLWYFLPRSLPPPLPTILVTSEALNDYDW